MYAGTMQDYASALFLFFAGVILLLLVRLLFLKLGNIPMSDAYGHLIHVNDIRESGHRASPGLSPGYQATSGTYAYPYLMHWVLSFFSEDHVDLIARNLGLMMDIALWSIFGALGVTGYLTWYEMTICLLLLITTPEFVRPDRAQNSGLSARKPGLVLATAALLLFSIYVSEGNVLLLVLALLFGGAVLLTNKFSLQALIFITAGLALFSSPSWALFTAGCFGTALLLSRGAYLKVLEGHARHLYFYATVLQNVHRKVNDKNILPFRLLTAVRKKFSGKGSTSAILEEVHNNIPLQAALNNPFLIPAVVLIFIGSPVGGLIDGFTLWIAAGTGAFLLTSLPGLRFLGEPERYLEYVFLPSAVVVAKSMANYGSEFRVLTYTTMVFGALVILAYVYATRKLTGSGGGDPGFDDVVSFFRDKNPAVVVIQPSNKGTELAFKTQHKTLVFVGSLGSTSETLEEFKKLHPVRYPCITDDVEWLGGRYDPRWVVYDMRRMRDTIGLQPPSGEPTFTSGGFSVYRFEQLR